MTIHDSIKAVHDAHLAGANTATAWAALLGDRMDDMVVLERVWEIERLYTDHHLAAVQGTEDDGWHQRRSSLWAELIGLLEGESHG